MKLRMVLTCLNVTPHFFLLQQYKYCISPYLSAAFRLIFSFSQTLHGFGVIRGCMKLMKYSLFLFCDFHPMHNDVDRR